MGAENSSREVYQIKMSVHSSPTATVRCVNHSINSTVVDGHHLSLLLSQVPAGRSGGADPGHRPECVRHGCTNGADSEEDKYAKQRCMSIITSVSVAKTHDISGRNDHKWDLFISIVSPRH